MAYELRDNSGSLFKEKEKRNEKAPDWTGTVKINGKEMRVAAWEKQGRSGLFFSLNFSEMGPKKADSFRGNDSGSYAPVSGGQGFEPDPEVPF